MPARAIEHPFLRLLQALAIAAVVVALVGRGPFRPADPALALQRLGGDDPVGTAAAVAAATHPDGADEVLLVSGASFADALSAAGLATAADAPILLTDPDGVPSVTREALRDLRARRVTLLGGTAAVGEDVVTALEQDGLSVDRIAGAGRAATAAEVARRIAAVSNLDLAGRRTAVVANGEDFADALAAGALSASRASPLPILLSDQEALPSVTARALAGLEVEQVVLLGGEAALSAEVEQALVDLGLQVRRVAGAGWAATAARADDLAEESRGFTPPTALLVPSDDFAAALVAAPYAAHRAAAVLLLDGPEIVATDSLSWLERRCGSFTAIVGIGSGEQVMPAALAAAQAAATCTEPA